MEKTNELKMYEFDELDDEIQDDTITEFLLNDSSMCEEAINTLRHMKFDSKGRIVRGYDEE